MAGESSADELAKARTELAAATDRAVHLERAVVSHRKIGMAMGILMERHRITEEQAFDRLRELSQRRNVKLRDIAELIVYTGNADQLSD